MLREDDPSRFDYLFEPLEDDAADGDTLDDGHPAEDPPDADHRRSGATRIALAAFTVATLAGGAAVVMLLLQRPEPADHFDAPISPAPASTAAPIVTQRVLVPPPVVTPSEVRTPEPTAIIEPEPRPPPDAPTAGSEPDVGVTRSPISVQPEPRPPFPNQNPQPGDSDEHRGGLLGGGGLPGPL